MDFEATPSFYNNKEYFAKYLGSTSYYKKMQEVVKKIVELEKPFKVLEMGSALGTTTLELANAFPGTLFEGLDNRSDVVEKANMAAADICNAHFFVGDMTEFAARKEMSQYDLIFLLYSFHHIVDPLSNKEKFLRDCYENMRPGTYLLIEETFLPEEAKSLQDSDKIGEQYRQRSEEGNASTFWASLNGLGKDDVQLAKAVGEFSGTEEGLAGEHVVKRDEEFLVKFSWLTKAAQDCGFGVIVAQPVNCIGEYAILLQKWEREDA